MDTPQSRGIEVRCTVGGVKYAIEHTTLDPYTRRRLDDQQFLAVMDALQKDLAGNPALHPGYWYAMYVDIHAFSQVPKQEIVEVRERLKTWALEAAKLFSPPALHHTEQLTAKPPRVPVRTLLQCTWFPAMGRCFSVGRLAPEELEPGRRELMREALSKKGQKLQAENKAGAHTVLVLEDFNSALSNHIVIGQALRAELPPAGFAIVEVFLIDTRLAEQWHVFLLKTGAEYRPTPTLSPQYWSFNPEELQDITNGTAK